MLPNHVTRLEIQCGLDDERQAHFIYESEIVIDTRMLVQSDHTLYIEQ
jgi:hypothetical protein